VAASIRFGAQELGIGTISPKMVEQQFEEDKDADLVSSQLGKSRCLIQLLPSTSPISLLSWFCFPMEVVLIFVTPTMRAGKEAYHPLFPHVQCPK
jgi:hypothetical protein